jgi:DnaJ-class molecular chaperone
MKQKNYYELLGVSETATEPEIKKAFRTLAKECHPDRHPGDAAAEARFKDINEAYEVLGDADKRRKYDELRRYSSGGGQQGSMSYEDFLRRFGGARSADNREFTWGFGGSSLDDIFANLFGGSGARAASRQKQRGSRSNPFSGGNPFGGANPFSGGNPFSRGQAKETIPTEPQPTADPFFKRKGDDAYVDITINLAQALLGSKIRVRTPGGASVHVKIAAGIEPGRVLRVPGMGFSDGGRTGDLYIRTKLVIPATLTDEQREAAVRFAEAMGMKH